MFTLNKSLEVPILFKELPIGSWFYQRQSDGDILLGVKILPFKCREKSSDKAYYTENYNAITRFIGGNADSGLSEFSPDYCPTELEVIQTDAVEWE